MNTYLTKILALTLLLGTAVEAAPPVSDHGVVADLAVTKVSQRPSGQKTFGSPRGTESGDIVEYRITYRNTTYGMAHGVVGTLSIPADRMSYAPESTLPGVLLEASVDGKTFAPAPLLRLAVCDDGSTKMEPVPPSEYRFLRWHLGDLPARGSFTVKARMRVNEPPVVLVTARSN